MAARAPKRLSATQWYVRSEPGNSESGSNASSGESKPSCTHSNKLASGVAKSSVSVWTYKEVNSFSVPSR